MDFKTIQLIGYNDTGADIKYDLELRGNVTIIKGYSGTGKTLLCQVVRQMIRNGDTSKAVFDSTFTPTVTISALKGCKDKIIFFDDADIVVKGDLLNYILKDKRNYYVLFRRNNFDVHLSPNYYAELVKGEDNVRRLRYYWEKVGWYD